MTDKAYKSVALGVRALNTSSFLGRDVCRDRPMPLYSPMRRAGFGKGYGHHGGAGESASAQFIQALLPRAIVQLLDVAVDPKGLFSPTMTTMQSRCEENKWEGEALKTCMPRKAQPPPAPTSRPSFAQAVARPLPNYRIPRRPGAHPRPPAQPKTEAVWVNKPAAPVDQHGGKQAPGREA